MTDEQNPEQEDSPNFRKLREANDRLKQENDDLRRVAASNMVQVAGFDPKHRLTQLVLDQFLQSEDAELTPDRFRTFAEEYQLPSSSNEGEDEQGEDATAAFDALQQGADSLRRATEQGDQGPSRQDQINTAEADGDYMRAMALKTQGLREGLVKNVRSNT